MKRRFVFFVIFAAIVTSVLSDRTLAQVTSDRLLRASEEPQNWITYSGGYAGQRHSPLTQITPANVKNLELKWILPNQVFGAWQSSPIVVDGMMYVTQRPNDVLAVDAKTGRVFWQYRYTVSPDARVCCGANNRGVAILGDTLYSWARSTGTSWRSIARRDARCGMCRRRSEARVLDHDGASDRQGQGPRRLGWWRIRHSRLHRRLRREDRQRAVALLHDSRTRGEGPRHVGGRLLEDRAGHLCGSRPPTIRR